MERRSPPESFFSRGCMETLPARRRRYENRLPRRCARRGKNEERSFAPLRMTVAALGMTTAPLRMTAAPRMIRALLGFFDHGFGADYYYYAVFCDGVTRAVGFCVVADYCSFGQADVAVDDGAADATAAADIHVIEDDALIELAVTIHAHVEAEDGFGDASARNNRARANDGIERDAHAGGIGENEFGGRILLLPGVQRPAFVVEVEDWGDGDQVHIGFVVGLDGADIAPVGFFFFIFVAKIVGKDAMLFDDARDDVFAEIVIRFGIFGVGDQDGNEQLGIEKIDAHGGVHFVRMNARALGFGGLFFEADDAPVFIGFDDAETAGSFLRRNFESGDGNVRTGFDVLLEHLLIIHLVDVVAGKNEDEIGLLGADGIDVLIDGVGGALIPVLGDAHLRSEHFDEIAVAHQRGPSLAHVTIEAERFVLGEDEDAAQIAIQAIGKGDVNDAVDAAEGDGGLGAIASEGPKAFALATGQQDRKCVAHQRHGNAPPESPGLAEDILAASASGLKERPGDLAEFEVCRTLLRMRDTGTRAVRAVMITRELQMAAFRALPI